MLDHTINLTFHGIGEPKRRLDPGEQDVWVSRDRFLSLLDLVKGRDDVAISFDDGNVSDVEHAMPALRERGLVATFFVVAGRLGTPHFVDEDAVRALAAEGMEIGCHGMLHRPWRGLDERALHEELVDAKTVLEQAIKRPVTRAACPFGSYDRRVLRTLRGCGYEHVYTSDGGTARPTDFLQARNSIGAGDDSTVLERIAALDSTPDGLWSGAPSWRSSGGDDARSPGSAQRGDRPVDPMSLVVVLAAWLVCQGSLARSIWECWRSGRGSTANHGMLAARMFGSWCLCRRTMRSACWPRDSGRSLPIGDRATRCWSWLTDVAIRQPRSLGHSA